MPSLSRRNLFIATAAATAIPAVHTAAAKSPSASLPRGIERLEIAGARVTAISDGTGAQKTSIAVADPERLKSLMAKSFMTPESLEHFRNVFLIETGDRVILVDAGFGAPRGKAIARLSELGIDRAAVTDVLLTHCHGDHVSGLIENGTAVFSRATLWVSREDIAHFTNPATPERARVVVEKVLTAYKGRVKHFSDAETVAGGLVARMAPGHTPGHAFFWLDEQVVFCGDVAHMAAVQFADPSINMTYDMDPELSAKCRVALFRDAAQKGYWLAGAHLPFPGLGHVLAAPECYIFLPTAFRDRA